ncbi:MAG: M48 family metallopeptidase [Candidatus Lambdaproteobacteria bacterium]|nr:M48 family metallopeptidase [Candidatus Lambdaproteobacteria bacterium]
MQPSDLVLAVFLALFLLHWALETALDGLNLVHVLRVTPRIPPELAAQVTPGQQRRAAAYAAARLRLGLVRRTVLAGAVLALLLSGVLPAWEAALAGWGLEPPHRGVGLLVSIFVALGIAGLPFSLIATFGIERRFGFNRSTFPRWLGDRLKGLALSAALGLPLLYAVLWFMGAAGAAWWLWVFALVTAVQLVLAWLYPALIAPLFNRFTPLPEGTLRSRLEALAHAAGFRTRGLFVMDASRRSGHSNAYFFGLLRPRIVLFDTLLAQLDAEQIAAVLAHEIGHFRLRHVLQRVALSSVSLGLLLYALSWLIAWPPVFQAFGFAASSPHAALALAMLCGEAFTFWLGPLGAAWSRRHEYAADAYAAALLGDGAPMREALVRLNTENLAHLQPHPWYGAWHHSHPTLLQRLAALRAPSTVPGGRPA